MSFKQAGESLGMKYDNSIAVYNRTQRDIWFMAAKRCLLPEGQDCFGSIAQRRSQELFWIEMSQQWELSQPKKKATPIDVPLIEQFEDRPAYDRTYPEKCQVEQRIFNTLVDGEVRMQEISNKVGCPITAVKHAVNHDIPNNYLRLTAKVLFDTMSVIAELPVVKETSQ